VGPAELHTKSVTAAVATEEKEEKEEMEAEAPQEGKEEKVGL
jgi:hypothetical protein